MADAAGDDTNLMGYNHRPFDDDPAVYIYKYTLDGDAYFRNKTGLQSIQKTGPYDPPRIKKEDRPCFNN